MMGLGDLYAFYTLFPTDADELAAIYLACEEESNSENMGGLPNQQTVRPAPDHYWPFATPTDYLDRTKLEAKIKEISEYHRTLPSRDNDDAPEGAYVDESDGKKDEHNCKSNEAGMSYARYYISIACSQKWRDEGILVATFSKWDLEYTGEEEDDADGEEIEEHAGVDIGGSMVNNKATRRGFDYFWTSPKNVGITWINLDIANVGWDEYKENDGLETPWDTANENEGGDDND